MSEERTQYTTQSDELTRLRAESIRLRNELIKQLENTLNGYSMIQGRHAAMIAERDARIAELEAMMRDTEDDLAATITAQARRIAELEATVQRLEADNRRLRHLDAMPVDAMRRLVEYCEWTQSEDYTAEQYVSDYGAAMAHFRTLDGDA